MPAAQVYSSSYRNQPRRRFTQAYKAQVSGHVFVFRVRKGDRLKVLWWSGDGMCLLAKRLEHGHFVWPSAESGAVHLSPAQLSMLLEGIDWRRPARTHTPTQI
jgi:transposase